MTKEVLIFICGGLFLVMMIIAAFEHPAVQNASVEMLHEFKTADFWESAAYTPAASASLPGQDPNQQIALANPLPAVAPDKPVLINKFGAE